MTYDFDERDDSETAPCEPAHFDLAYNAALSEISERISSVGLYACDQFADLITLICMIENPEELDCGEIDLRDPIIAELANAKLAEIFLDWHQSTRNNLQNDFDKKEIIV